MTSLRATIFATIIALATSASFARADWKKVGMLPVPIACGYFFDEQAGVIGGGSRFGSSSYTPGIFLTSDGGTTWTASQLPSNNGRVSCIFMRDKLIGYATVMFSETPLWETTDGGSTWHAFPRAAGQQSLTSDGTCVYATSKAITVTLWDDVAHSLVSGTTKWLNDFSRTSDNYSNAIDFIDDTTGVMTRGPNGGSCYYTIDGGATWKAGASLVESWGIYANPKSREFYTLPEGDMSRPSNLCYVSSDHGATWRNRGASGLGSAARFTGHIDGVGSVMYVQTTRNNGFFRSTDAGLNWTNVSGPSNQRDTRFCVLGCNGATVYAFDSIGSVWKTTDGGDGTLSDVEQTVTLRLQPAKLEVASGDTVLIPLYIEPSSQSFTFIGRTVLDVHYSLDSKSVSDLEFLPIEGVSASRASLAGASSSITLELPPGFTLTQAMTLGTLRVRAVIADSLHQTIELQPAVVQQTSSECLAFGFTANQVDLNFVGCKDSLLLRKLLSQPLLSIAGVLPNPASDRIRVRLANIGHEPVRLELCDALGVPRLSQETHALEPEFGVSDLPSGVYYLRVSQGSSVRSLPLVIQH